MFGVSYMGGAQMLIAAQKPPHLVSIAPVVTTIDQFARHPNGVFLSMAFPSSGDRARDANPGYPVDADPNGTMAAAAVPEHVAENHYLDDCWPGPTVYRNDFIAEIGVMPSLASSPINYLDEIKGSGVAMYNMAGWWDQAPTSQFGAWKLWGGD
jgi:predicted acyl esterase